LTEVDEFVNSKSRCFKFYVKLCHVISELCEIMSCNYRIMSNYVRQFQHL